MVLKHHQKKRLNLKYGIATPVQIKQTVKALGDINNPHGENPPINVSAPPTVKRNPHRRILIARTVNQQTGTDELIVASPTDIIDMGYAVIANQIRLISSRPSDEVLDPMTSQTLTSYMTTIMRIKKTEDEGARDTQVVDDTLDRMSAEELRALIKDIEKEEKKMKLEDEMLELRSNVS